MPIATRNLINALVPQLFDLKRVGLKRIAVAILGHLADDSAAVSELAHLAATPSVQTAFLVSVTAVILQEKLKICLPTTLYVHISSLFSLLLKIQINYTN